MYHILTKCRVPRSVLTIKRRLYLARTQSQCGTSNLLRLQYIQRSFGKFRVALFRALQKRNRQLSILALAVSIPVAINGITSLAMIVTCPLGASDTKCVAARAAMTPSTSYGMLMTQMTRYMAFIGINFVNGIIYAFCHTTHFLLYVLLSKRFRQALHKLLARWSGKAKNIVAVLVSPWGSGHQVMTSHLVILWT